MKTNVPEKLPEILPISPLKNFSKFSPKLPGSKSITNRALILAALRSGTTLLRGALFSEDTKAMIFCLKKLGFKIDFDEAAGTIFVEGKNGEIPNSKAELFVENAGTAARFLTAFLALKKGGEFFLDGSEAMRKRPMRGLLSALETLGCEFSFSKTPGCFPFSLKTSGIRGNAVAVDAAASSQILSALLLIAPAAKPLGQTFSVELLGETVSRPFVEMTLKMIRQFGGAAEIRGNAFICGGGFSGTTKSASTNATGTISEKPKFLAGTKDLSGTADFIYEIEPDATAASYFAILPFVQNRGEVRISGLSLQNSLQGDTAFSALLSTPPNDLLSIRENFSARGNDEFFVEAGTSRNVFSANFNEISDTFLTLAAVSPLLSGMPNSATKNFSEPPNFVSTGTRNSLKIFGIAHTRKQETDRIFAMAAELSKILGEKNVFQSEDALEIFPISLSALRSRAEQFGGNFEIETYNDHRIAMSFAILGTFDLFGNGKPWISIKNPSCCAKTFPNFFEILPK